MPAISAATAGSTSVGDFLPDVDNLDPRMRASPRDQKRLVDALPLTAAYMTHPLSSDLCLRARTIIISRTISPWCHVVALFRSLRLVAVAFISRTRTNACTNKISSSGRTSQAARGNLCHSRHLFDGFKSALDGALRRISA